MLRNDIEIIIREELEKLKLINIPTDYESWEHKYRCSVCNEVLEENWDEENLNSIPIPHKSIVECFQAFLKRVKG